MVPFNPNYNKSLGILRINRKTKQKSPDLVGRIKILDDLVLALSRILKEQGGGYVLANIAGWRYKDNDGPFLRIELSGPYEKVQQVTDQNTAPTIFDDITESQEDND